MRRLTLIALFLLTVALAGCAGCRWPWEPEVTPTPTATLLPVPSVTATATNVPTATVTVRVTRTPRPSVTPVVTVTPTATTTPRATVTATATAVPPVGLRGVHRVRTGDTLWGVACSWYAGPLRAGANPLTPCTCWPGIATLNGVVPPQFIGIGWVLRIPQACTQ